MKKNNKWFGIIETLVWMSIFMFLVISFSSNFDFSLKNFVKWKEEILYKNIIDDITWYLITTKKNYWTINFHHLISQWDMDLNCNWNYENEDISIRDYCFFYPYYSDIEQKIKFYNTSLDNSNVTIDNVFLSNNNIDGFNINNYLSYYWLTNERLLITIWLKENFSDVDLFEWFISIKDLNTNYITKQNITIK